MSNSITGNEKGVLAEVFLSLLYKFLVKVKKSSKLFKLVPSLFPSPFT